MYAVHSILLLQLPFAAAAFTVAGSSVVIHRRLHRYSRCDRPPCIIVVTGGAAASVGSDDESTDEGIRRTTTTHQHLGLLRGVNLDVDNFYADEIDTSREGLAWLDQPGLMWEAATKDAATRNVSVEEYIMDVKANIQHFAKSGIIYDRKELLMSLEESFTARGSVTLLLGGKNVGKSTVLKSLVKVSNKSSKLLALYVDARHSPGRLDIGLANGIAQLYAEKLARWPNKIDWLKLRGLGIKSGFAYAIDFTIGFVRTVVGIKKTAERELRESLQSVLGSVLNPNGGVAKATESLLVIFNKIAMDRNAFPVLVVDEANLVLGIDNSDKADDDTKNILSSIVSFSKQDHRMSVIMASSEHAYPYRLQRAGFNLQDADLPIFAGEIPPKEMWNLLVKATYEEGNNKGKPIIGMGPHLAELCLAAYGGHFSIMQKAIINLSWQQDRVMASKFIPDLIPEIRRCLKKYTLSRPLLEAMAQYGFAPLKEPDDPAAELISEQNLGGTITMNAACIGIAETKWIGTGCQRAVIPSSQCVRLRIAQVLLDFPCKKS